MKSSAKFQGTCVGHTVGTAQADGGRPRSCSWGSAHSVTRPLAAGRSCSVFLKGGVADSRSHLRWGGSSS